MQKRNIGNYRWLPNGKCLLRISCGFDDYGKRMQFSRTVECKSDREAEKLLMQFYMEREKEYNKKVNSAPDTLEKLYAEWLENYVKRNLSYQSITFYEGIWERHIKSKGKIKLENIKPKNLYDILDSAEGARTRKGIFQVLNNMFNRAVKWGYMLDNPCRRIDSPKYAPKEKSILSEDDLAIISEHLPKEETKYRAIFYCAALLGLRRQEILGLSWDCIDFTNSELIINKAAVQIKGEGAKVKDTKTTSSRRKLSMPSVLRDELLLLKNEQGLDAARLDNLWNDENWVFTQWNGKLMNIYTPTIWWKDFCKAHSITDNVTLHSLRHTAATFMIVNNVPISTVSAVLGHAKQSTTLNFYSHVLEDSKKDAISITENILKTQKIRNC